ncbi:MAG TPA: hypothetical protein VE196_12965 [Pseudonocardiaceae bacterium]|nr:hypothetical protein [Pseudonocardiaceae bacterium]
MTDQLVTEGVDKFTEAFRQLLSSVEQALAGPSKTEPWRLHRSLPRDLAERVDATIDEWRATGRGGLGATRTAGWAGSVWRWTKRPTPTASPISPK